MTFITQDQVHFTSNLHIVTVTLCQLPMIWTLFVGEWPALMHRIKAIYYDTLSLCCGVLKELVEYSRSQCT